MEPFPPSHSVSVSPPGAPRQFPLQREQEAHFLQGPGARRLRGLALEEKGCQGIFHPEMEKVLVHSEGFLPVLVHKPECKYTLCSEKVKMKPYAL